jgi:hypothetical protein
MKNISLTIDDDVLFMVKEYARKNKISFNALVRKSLETTVKKSSNKWLDDMFVEMDKDNVSSNGEKWSREEIYSG